MKEGKFRLDVFIVIFLLLLLPVSYSAVDSPTPSQFKKYDTFGDMDLYSGDMSFSIPLFDIVTRGGLNFPLALNYHAGIVLEQPSSSVGLGWDLNIPTITRTVLGLPDDYVTGGEPNLHVYNKDTIPNGYNVERGRWSELQRVFNFAFSMVFSVMVSYAIGGMGGADPGFGTQLGAKAGGSLAGSMMPSENRYWVTLYEWIDQPYAPLDSKGFLHMTQADLGPTASPSEFTGVTYYDGNFPDIFNMHSPVYTGNLIYGDFSSGQDGERTLHLQSAKGMLSNAYSEFSTSSCVPDNVWPNTEGTSANNLEGCLDATVVNYNELDGEGLVSFDIYDVGGMEYNFEDNVRFVPTPDPNIESVSECTECSGGLNYSTYARSTNFPWKDGECHFGEYGNYNEMYLDEQYTVSYGITSMIDHKGGEGPTQNRVDFEWSSYTGTYGRNSPYNRDCFQTPYGGTSFSRQFSQHRRLQTIESSLYKVEFTYDTTTREDLRPNYGELRSPILTELKLYAKYDGATQFLEGYKFYYDYNLATGTPDNLDAHGRLTLRSISQVDSAGVESTEYYKFEYYGEDVQYDPFKFDRWGYYCDECSALDHEVANDETFTPWVWSLKKVHLPLGGTKEWSYSSDKYDFINGMSISDIYAGTTSYSVRGGGLKVDRVVACDVLNISNMGWPSDYVEQDVDGELFGLGCYATSYEYGDGVISSEPGNFLDYSGRLFSGSSYTPPRVGYTWVNRVAGGADSEDKPFGYERFEFTTPNDTPAEGDYIPPTLLKDSFGYTYGFSVPRVPSFPFTYNLWQWGLNGFDDSTQETLIYENKVGEVYFPSGSDNKFIAFGPVNNTFRFMHKVMAEKDGLDWFTSDDMFLVTEDFYIGECPLPLNELTFGFGSSEAEIGCVEIAFGQGEINTWQNEDCSDEDNGALGAEGCLPNYTGVQCNWGNAGNSGIGTADATLPANKFCPTLFIFGPDFATDWNANPITNYMYSGDIPDITQWAGLGGLNTPSYEFGQWMNWFNWDMSFSDDEHACAEEDLDMEFCTVNFNENALSAEFDSKFSCSSGGLGNLNCDLMSHSDPRYFGANTNAELWGLTKKIESYNVDDELIYYAAYDFDYAIPKGGDLGDLHKLAYINNPYNYYPDAAWVVNTRAEQLLDGFIYESSFEYNPINGLVFKKTTPLYDGTDNTKVEYTKYLSDTSAFNDFQSYLWRTPTGNLVDTISEVRECINYCNFAQPCKYDSSLDNECLTQEKNEYAVFSPDEFSQLQLSKIKRYAPELDNENNNLWTVNEYLAYDRFGHILEEKDTDGNIIKYYYGDESELCSNGPNGYSHSLLTCTEDYAFTDEGMRPSPYQYLFSYYPNLILKSDTNVFGGETIYTYDSKHRLASVQNPLNSFPNVNYEYSSIYEQGCDADLETGCVNKVIKSSTIDDGVVFESIGFFDSLGRQYEEQTYIDGVTGEYITNFYTYEGASGRLRSVTMPERLLDVQANLGNRIYHVLNRVLGRLAPKLKIPKTGNFGETTYWSDDKAISRDFHNEDKLKLEARYTADSLGRVTKMYNPTMLNHNAYTEDDVFSTFDYAANRRGLTCESVTDELSNTAEICRDQSGNEVLYTNARGVSIEKEYDTLNRLKKIYVSERGGQKVLVHENFYDGLVLSSSNNIDAGSKTFTYADPEGEYLGTRAIATSKDANLNTMRYYYDTVGRVTSVYYCGSSYQDSICTDSTGTLFIRNFYGEDPECHSVGNPNYRTRVCERITYNVVDGSQDNSIKYYYRSDGSGLVSSILENVGGMSFTTNYDYTYSGDLKTVTIDDTTTTYNYDKGDRISSMVFDSNGQDYTIRVDENYVESLPAVYQFKDKSLFYTDSAGQEVIEFKRKYYSDSALLSESKVYYDNGFWSYDLLFNTYNYDIKGNLDTISEVGETIPLNHASFSYDPISQLIGIDNSQGHYDEAGFNTLGYTYDEMGNRQTIRIDGSQVASYTYAYENSGADCTSTISSSCSNRLINDGTWSYIYHENGKLKSRSMLDGSRTETWFYSPSGRLSTINIYPSGGDPYSITYGYNALGNRVEKCVGEINTQEVTRYFYGKGSNPILMKTDTVTECISCIIGDTTADGVTNILDVILAVNIVLGGIDPTPSQACAADYNQDSILNILDVVAMVNAILG